MDICSKSLHGKGTHICIAYLFHINSTFDEWANFCFFFSSFIYLSMCPRMNINYKWWWCDMHGNESNQLMRCNLKFIENYVYVYTDFVPVYLILFFVCLVFIFLFNQVIWYYLFDEMLKNKYELICFVFLSNSF